MMAKTHMALGANCWLAYATMVGVNLEQSLVGTTVAVFGSLLPDIDHPSSKFGRLVPFISVPMSLIFGHRGITHSIFAIACLVFAWFFYGQSDHFYVIGALIIGYASHLAGDILTNSGVPLFYPYRLRVRAPITFNTGGLFEKLFFLGMSLCCAYLEYLLITSEILHGKS